MKFFTNPQDAATHLFQDVTENASEYPEDIRSEILRLLQPGRSISFAVSESAELIFARKTGLSKRVVKMGAEMAICAAHNRINNFADDEGRRGRAIAEALRRHSGERAPPGIDWPPKEDDPAPKEIYVPGPDNPTPIAPAPEPRTTPAEDSLATQS